MARFIKWFGRWLFKVLIAIDQLGNVFFLDGLPDHTISGRVGFKAQTTGKKRWLIAEKVINALFFFDPNHCRSSIEWDEVNKK